MAISLETATRLSTDLVRVIKLVTSVRQHAPRLHPGVEPAAFPILFRLVEAPVRVSTLAECVHSDVSTVSRQVAALVSHGLVEKMPDPVDGRAFVVSLSDEGSELVERLKAGRGQWFQLMLADWEPHEAEVFNDYLERFADSFEASRDLLKVSYAAQSDAAAPPVGPDQLDSTSKEQ